MNRNITNFWKTVLLVFLFTFISRVRKLRVLNYTRRIASRALCSLLVLSLLATSIPAAAPRTTVVTLNEYYQDIRITWLSSNFGAVLGKWTDILVPSFFANKQQTQTVSRIEIQPGGNLTIRQGEPVNFTAIGYSSEGIPVGGLKFKWEIRDLSRNSSAHNLPNGTFHARSTGKFLVKAEAEGVTAEVNIEVEKNVPLMIMKKIKDDEAKGKPDLIKKLKDQNKYKTEEISSRKDYRNRNNNHQAEHSENNQSLGDITQAVVTSRETVKGGPSAGVEEALEGNIATPKTPARMLRPSDEDGWNNNNWWLADDPNNSIGNPPGTSPEAGAGNGNFQLSAPVAALPGRGIDLNLILNYNSRVWSKSGSQMIFDSERGFPAPGWSLGFGKMMFMGTGGGCMLIDADGTNHGYTGTVSNYTSGTYSSTSFNGHTTDGTFIDYSCWVSTYNNVTSMSATTSLPNGTQIQYYANSVNGKQAFPTQITDSQGNYITVAYRNNRGPEIQTVTDTLGRVVNFNYDSSSPARLISVTAPKMDNAGTRTVVRLHYKQLTLNPGFAGGITTDTNNSYPYVVDAIYYPGTNTGYWFNDGDSYSSYGMIAKVVEQRGMSWSGAAGDQGTVTPGTMSKQALYDYPLNPDYTLTDAPTYKKLTESWAGMDTVPAEAKTEYLVNNNDYRSDGTTNSPARSIKVTRPNGTISIQYSYRTPNSWTDGLIFADDTFVMNGSTRTDLGSSLTSWQQGNYDSPRPSWTKVTGEKGHTLQTTYTYGTNYNQITSQKEYDYNSTTAVLKETRKSYENSSSYTNRHIFNLVKTVEIRDSAGVKVAQTDYEYDNNAVINGTQNHNLKATPGVTMHLATSDPYTSETVDGACINGYFNYPQCTYEGEYIWVYQAGGYEDICRYECTEYDPVSAYDPNSIFRGNVTKVTSYADAAAQTGAITQTKQYDATGNLVAESASCCELKTYVYDDPVTQQIDTQYAYPVIQTRGSSDPNSAIRNTSTAVYDFYTGLVKQTTAPNGRKSLTSYDPETLRPLITTVPTVSAPASISLPLTVAYSQTSYDDGAMTITEEARASDGTLAAKSIKYLNGVGQIKKEETFGANNVKDIVEVKYNNLGQLWKQTRPYRTGDTPQWTETTYDLLGRTKTVTAPDGSVTQAFYNETDSTKIPDSVTVTTGNTIRVTDPWGRERWGRYDAQERLVEVVEPNPNGNGSVLSAGSLSTKYSYNTLGNLTETVQGAQHRTFKYDSLGRLTRQKLAEQIATLNEAGNYVVGGGSSAMWSNAFVYDERSNVTQKTDARGVKTHYVYADPNTGAPDPLNRLRVKYYELPAERDTSYPINAAFNVSYDYETSGDQDRIRKMESSGLAKEEYVYDSEGRVRDYKQTVAYRESYPMTMTYIYDSLDRIKEFHYPAQYGIGGSPRKIVEQSYDSASRLSTLKYGGQQQAGDIVYNAADQTTSINIGAAGANQVNENYTFDPQTGLLTNQKVQRGAQTLLDLSYDYQRNNSVGALNGKTGHLTKILNNLDHNKDRSYEFDALGRLTKAKGGVNGALWQQQYGYDRYGNRTSVIASGVAANNSPIPTDGYANLSFEPTSNRITTTGFQYDAAGNQTKAQAADGSWVKLEYDYANRLSAIRRESDDAYLESFHYSPSGNRIMATDHITNLKTFRADVGGKTITEYVEYNWLQLSWTKSYVYLGGSRISTASNNNGSEYVEFNHPDRLGTRTVTNQQFATSSEQTTLPFGTALNAESTLSNNRNRFTSYDRSDRTGLDYAVNRSYDSKQGRFTQVDPIGFSASSLISPQTLNLYSYCGNDPINHTDPDGLFFGSLFKWIGKIFKAVLIAVAVFVAVVAVMAASMGFAAPVVAKLALVSASLFAQALAPPKIGAIIGIITGIVLMQPGIIVNFAGGAVEAAGKIKLWQRILAASSFVGSIANSFAQDKKKNDAERKRRDIIKQTVLKVISRLNSNPKCLKTINNDGYELSPASAIKTIDDRGDIKWNKDLDVSAQSTPNQTDSGWIDVGSSFFKKTIRDGRGNDWNKITGLNEYKTREFILLHELRHLYGSSHGDDISLLKKDITEILKDCFGVTPDFSGGIK